MKLKVVLSIAAAYMALVGVGIMFVPHQFGIGAVPADASPALIAFLRIFGGPCVGIAVLNWVARDAERSSARNAIVLANMVGLLAWRRRTSGGCPAVAHDRSRSCFSWLIYR